MAYATAQDELNRQDPQMAEMQKADAIIGGTNNLSLAEGLRMQRESLAKAQGIGSQGQQLTDKSINPLIEKRLNFEGRVSGEDPLASIRAAAGLVGSREDFKTKNLAQQKTALDFLTDLIGKAKDTISTQEQIELKKRELKMAEDEAKISYKEKGYELDEDGNLKPISGTENQLKGADAVAEVVKQGGDDLLKSVTTKEEKQKIAESILETGGVKKYRDQLPGSEIKQGIIQDLKDLLAADTAPIAGVIRYGFIPGTEANRLQIIMDHLKSSLSLDNVKLLKGQGAISDAERRLLELASSRLKQSQKNVDFRKELQNVLSGLTDEESDAKTIKVKLKSSGQTGTIPESEFDDKVYERI